MTSKSSLVSAVMVRLGKHIAPSMAEGLIQGVASFLEEAAGLLRVIASDLKLPPPEIPAIPKRR